MIAAEQNKKYKVRSLLEPEITVTGPMGDRIKPTKTGVHPNNAFDQSPSGFNTPHDSEEEADIDDIRRAQKLAIHLTAINSTPQTKRTVRTIFRGDFAQMQKEAEDETRRVRKYLVATDLSEEAAHALEWTIGTVLRDGDTMLAIYCVDEETGILPATVDPSALATQAAVASEAGAQAPPLTPPTVPSHPQGSSPLANLSNISVNTASVSPDNRGQTKDEQERFRAVDDITERVSKLLRKTKLQVRVVIEVLHCKSPKHMICEVIDFIQPTLVILGSRGQSALKGYALLPFILRHAFLRYILRSSRCLMLFVFPFSYGW
jgi:nucleotide-binding universal stress UspA family protein